MNAVANVQGAFRINGQEAHSGSLTIVRDLHRITTLGPRRDHGWKHRDSNNHFHAYSTGEHAYPTLYETHHVCESPHQDGEAWWCECFTSWHCLICHEAVTPGMIDGPHEAMHPGLSHWEVEITFMCDCTVPDVGSVVSVEMTTDGTTRFGIAVVTAMKTASGPLFDCRVTLTGAGPLGRMGKR